MDRPAREELDYFEHTIKSRLDLYHSIRDGSKEEADKLMRPLSDLISIDTDAIRDNEEAKTQLFKNDMTKIICEMIKIKKDLDVLISGSTALSAVLKGKRYNIKPGDLDLYLLNCNKDKVFYIEWIIKQIFPIQAIIVVRNPLTVTWLITPGGNEPIIQIQVIILQIKSWAEMLISFHGDIVCIGYDVQKEEFLYLKGRWENTLIPNKIHYFCNILNSDSKSSLQKAVSKYTSRGFICRMLLRNKNNDKAASLDKNLNRPLSKITGLSPFENWHLTDADVESYKVNISDDQTRLHLLPSFIKELLNLEILTPEPHEISQEISRHRDGDRGRDGERERERDRDRDRELKLGTLPKPLFESLFDCKLERSRDRMIETTMLTYLLGKYYRIDNICFSSTVKDLYGVNSNEGYGMAMDLSDLPRTFIDIPKTIIPQHKVYVGGATMNMQHSCSIYTCSYRIDLKSYIYKPIDYCPLCNRVLMNPTVFT